MSEFRRATLKTGLEIVAEIDPRSYSAAFGYFVRAGSRNELDCQSGLSHFLEHMMFKGTERRSAEDVNRELDELGGQSNAYTTEEQTVYYATVLPKFQDRIIDLLTDMMTPILDEDEFETERKVILEEIAKYEDQPPFGAFERAMEVHFGPRGLGRRVLGTGESISGMTAARMRDYFNRRYRPENIVLAATGNVDFDGLVASLQQKTKSWSTRPAGETLSDDDPETIPEGIELDCELEVPDASQGYLVRIGKGPASDNPDRYATHVLASIMGDEGSSRLFWELIDTGRAEIATMWPHEFSDSGAWLTYLVCAPEDVQANRDLIDQVAESIIKDGVESAELGQVINKGTAAMIMQSERPSNRLFSLGGRWLTHKQYVSTDEALEKLRAVDANAVTKAASKYLAEKPLDIVGKAMVAS